LAYLSIDYNGFPPEHLLKSQEELGQILNDDKVLNADHFLNKEQGESGLEAAFAPKGRIKLLLQVVGLEVIRIALVPLGTLLPVPFPFTMSVSTSLLAIFEPRVRYKPTATDPARAFLSNQVLRHGSVPLIPLRENMPNNTGRLCHGSVCTRVQIRGTI
jgi:hypothetical protein